MYFSYRTSRTLEAKNKKGTQLKFQSEMEVIILFFGSETWQITSNTSSEVQPGE